MYFYLLPLQDAEAAWWRNRFKVGIIGTEIMSCCQSLTPLRAGPFLMSHDRVLLIQNHHHAWDWGPHYGKPDNRAHLRGVRIKKTPNTLTHAHRVITDECVFVKLNWVSYILGNSFFDFPRCRNLRARCGQQRAQLFHHSYVFFRSFFCYTIEYIIIQYYYCILRPKDVYNTCT